MNIGHLTRPAVRFQATGPKLDAGEKPAFDFLQTILTGIKQGKAQVVGRNAAKYEVTLQVDNKLFLVSGVDRPQMGTMPAFFSIKSLKDGEEVSYAGAGCFSLPSVNHRDAQGARTAKPFYGASVDAFETVLDAISKL